jgi:hypothetical protein
MTRENTKQEQRDTRFLIIQSVGIPAKAGTHSTASMGPGFRRGDGIEDWQGSPQPLQRLIHLALAGLQLCLPFAAFFQHFRRRLGDEAWIRQATVDCRRILGDLFEFFAPFPSRTRCRRKWRRAVRAA